MEIGSRIKLQRLNKGITQEELAEGVISKSYLSKIENNQAIPAEEIIQILCERLEISYLENQREDTRKEIERFFEFLLLGDLENAHKWFIWVTDILEDKIDLDLIKLYEIHKIRYYVLNRDFKEAEVQIKHLDHFLADYNSLEKYYWYKFIGDFYYGSGIYELAFENYKIAENYLDFKLVLYEEEKSDLYYLISITAVQLWKLHLSIYYAEKALGYYQNVYKLSRCAKCHITIGIAYKRLGENDTAIDSYNKAYQIATALKDNNLLSNCHQNLGSLFFKKNQADIAASHYHKSLEKRQSGTISKQLITIVSLIELYFFEDDLRQAIKWMESAKNLLLKSSDVDEIIVLNINLYNHLMRGTTDSFEEFILNEAIPVLKQKRLKSEMKTYYKHLANYYFNNRKYKNACIYYQKAST